jgi:hypothetical protein
MTTGRGGGVLRRAEATAGCVAFAFLATGNSAGGAPAAPEPPIRAVALVNRRFYTAGRTDLRGREAVCLTPTWS